MFKLSLINPPERVLDGTYKYYLPFALLYLAAYLEEYGRQVEIIDIKPEKTYSQVIKNRIAGYWDRRFRKKHPARASLYDFTLAEIIKATEQSGAELIGLTCMTMEYNSVMRLAAILKARLKKPIVVGGIHASLYPEHFIYDQSPVDFVVIGEGEETLLELTQYLEAGKENYDAIDGIAYLKNGSCCLTRIRTVKNDLSISPIRAYPKLDMEFYCRPHAYVTRHVRISGVQIFTSRGCPYDCTFCSNARIRKMNKFSTPIRYRPMESVIEEIKFLKARYHIDAFYIMDDTFCVDKRHAEKFCTEFQKAALNINWAFETRANLLDEPMLKKMKAAGLVQIDVGVESGSDEMLKEIKKGITVKDTLEIFALAHKYRIRSFASLMVNLPNETWEQLQETICLLDKIRPSSGVIGTTIPLPKTELFDRYFASKISNDKEIIDLLGPSLSRCRGVDARFHFCNYKLDFKELIAGLNRKYFLFTELKLGIWYWKIFLRSQRKSQYLFTIACGVINVIKKILFG